MGEFLAKSWHKITPPIKVWKRIYGLNVCLDLRDGLTWWARSSKEIEGGERFHEMLAGIKGNVWDVGCNIGVFSLYAASQGNRVVAFDISPKAISLLSRSAKKNNLNISIVGRAFAVETFTYSPPKDADTRNRPLAPTSNDTETSMTYQEAEAKFGKPEFIKLDVEYAEVDFLRSENFRSWIRTNRIPLLVELHEKEFWDLVWNDVPHIRFSPCHVFFNHSR